MNTIFVIAVLICGDFGCVTLNDNRAYFSQKTCVETSMRVAIRFLDNLPPERRGTIANVDPKCFTIKLNREQV